MAYKISSSVNGGMSGPVKRVQTRSKDPHLAWGGFVLNFHLFLKTYKESRFNGEFNSPMLLKVTAGSMFHVLRMQTLSLDE